MRFSSFLPMLLLLFASPLWGQNQCSIYDLSATATATSPNACQFFIVLDFEHSGTTNQFTVKGNGVNYGTFPYDSVPVKLGPFTAGSTPTNLEFVVTDFVYQDCHDEVNIVVPPCGQSGSCDIYDVNVQVGDCNPGSLTYKLNLNFKVANPGNDFFEVWAENGTYLGIYPLASLPLTIPAFPWSGDATDHIKICINDHPDCCEIVQFQAPVCPPAPCSITNLTVEQGGCTSDSTYRAEINFDLVSSTLFNKFALWANDEFLGFYGIDDLPIKIDSFPWNGGTTDFVKVCIVDITSDPANPIYVCCKTLEFHVPDCLPIFPCGIQDLTVETDSCSSDSTFGIWVNFTVNDTSAVDSFHLVGNGHDFGFFGMNQLPLHIADFPWNGGIFSYIRVCTGTAITCCKEHIFVAPDCLPFGPCEVKDIFIQTGACTSDSTYKVRLSFQGSNPGDGTFTVWANGDSLGTFPLTAVPLQIDSFPWSGNDVDVVRICVNDSTSNTPCCREEEFHAPDCITGDSCAITNVVVDPGDCNPGGDSYKLHLNFEVQNPTNDEFELWTGNGTYLGLFKLSELPITIPNFPCNNSGAGVLKICINDDSDCCTTVEFQQPNCCDAGGPCEIYDLSVETGDCDDDDETYEIWLNFQVENPVGDQFGVWANGQFFGTYSLGDLPIHIPDFPWNGGQYDAVKVCLLTPNGAYTCCKTKEFEVPDCLGQQCEIYNLTVETGDCTGDSTYQVWLNFQVANPPGDIFGVWANGEFIGTFHLDSLPLQISDFPWNGGPNDVVKVCFVNSNDPAGPATCCRTKEFHVPDCLTPGGDCEIYDLSIETGDCTSDSTYQVWINFQVDNPPSDEFGLWANGEFLGNYSLDSLPLYLQYFPWNGGQHDAVKICFTNNGAVACCKVEEFAVPDCLNPGGPCEIYDLTVETGDCTSDSTYQAWINFQVDNPPGNTFGLWINGEFYDTYSLDSLPIYIQNFPWDGGPNDVVKVCFTNANDPNTACCRTKEFHVPDCLDPGGDCEIDDLTVETGDCTSDDTYEVWINFEVENPPSDEFGVWANGQFLGLFPLDSLPLYIPDFPWDGGSHDVVKVCFPNSAGAVTCCETEEFEVPNCCDPDPCKIYDLHVLKTPCLCGEFFAILTFEHQNGSDEGFDVIVNGVNYGNFPYDTAQPIILGPFPGDGTTEYEFVVQDHETPDACSDDFKLGKVNCMTPVTSPGNDARLTLSPNPVSSWLNVTAQLQSGVNIGESLVEIYHADGRLVRNLTVPEGSNFLLDVSDLPAGVYRLSLLASAGRVEGTFVKQ